MVIIGIGKYKEQRILYSTHPFRNIRLFYSAKKSWLEKMERQRLGIIGLFILFKVHLFHPRVAGPGSGSVC